eukprot:637066-Hanusia_phi.AAC.2
MEDRRTSPVTRLPAELTREKLKEALELEREIPLGAREKLPREKLCGGGRKAAVLSSLETCTSGMKRRRKEREEEREEEPRRIGRKKQRGEEGKEETKRRGKEGAEAEEVDDKEEQMEQGVDLGEVDLVGISRVVGVKTGSGADRQEEPEEKLRVLVIGQTGVQVALVPLHLLIVVVERSVVEANDLAELSAGEEEGRKDLREVATAHKDVVPPPELEHLAEVQEVSTPPRAFFLEAFAHGGLEGLDHDLADRILQLLPASETRRQLRSSRSSTGRTAGRPSPPCQPRAGRRG